MVQPLASLAFAGLADRDGVDPAERSGAALPLRFPDRRYGLQAFGVKDALARLKTALPGFGRWSPPRVNWRRHSAEPMADGVLASLGASARPEPGVPPGYLR